MPNWVQEMPDPESDKGLLVYLFSVSRNSVILGIDSSGGLDPHGNEIRTPYCSLDSTKLLEVLDHLDRHARPISTWQQLYQWLGRGNGWAFFTEQTAKDLIPHWLAKVPCSQLQDEDGQNLVGAPFLDLAMILKGISEETKSTLQLGWENMIGDSDELGKLYTMQIKSNMVITQQPLFID
jgi:hypothetical protein